ncbi:transcription factor SPT20 homolog [Cyclospora cayetanensis]|uniref:Transcription factor SPT20 homolog n=1 Tax=Cyclospora cayetanensis TaxID=88456 RepID=A0A6P6S2B0_9EIME|nr:transcription factor SPT20 homolog [Cyclospora cayetanensis]
MGCVLPCGELAATADMGVPRESADEDVEEELVIALPEGLGCLYTRTRRRRDEGLPLDLLALSVLLATGVLCGLGGVSELSLLGRLLVRLQEWAAALRFLTETLPQLRQNTANSCSGGSSAGVSAGSPECLPSVSLSALQILLTEARPCPRIRVPCSLAAERLLRKGWQLQQQMIAALVHAEDDAAEQLKCYERLQQAQQRRDRLVQLKQQLGGMRGVSAAENPTLSEEELQQAEAAVAAAQTAHATAEAAVMNSNQQLLDLEQQLHSSGIGGLQYESLFHELVAACAWQREAEALAACIEMESESTAKQHQQASNTLNTHRVLHPAYRNTAHLWRMVQVYEPLRQKSTLDRVLQFERRVRDLQVVGPLPQLTLTEGGTQAASVMLPAARGPVALLQQNPQQQDQVQRQRLSWELWLSLVDEANKLGLGIEAANLVKQLHARALVLQQKVQEAVSGQPIPSLEAAQAMLVEASNLPMETKGIAAVSAAVAAVDAWQQKGEAALQQLHQQLQLQQLQQRCGLPPQQLLQLQQLQQQQNQTPKTDALWALIEEAARLPILPEGIPAYVRLKKVSEAWS